MMKGNQNGETERDIAGRTGGGRGGGESDRAKGRRTFPPTPSASGHSLCNVGKCLSAEEPRQGSSSGQKDALVPCHGVYGIV